MIVFLTASGSEYEVDVDKKQIRRSSTSALSGEVVRVDSEWRPYRAISSIEVGEMVLIVWGDEVEVLNGSPQYAIPTTTTNMVLSVKDVAPLSTEQLN